MLDMNDMLSELGKLPAPTSLQTDVQQILMSTDRCKPFAEWLQSNRATTQQLILLAYLFNDGLIMMATNSEDEAEATHLQSVVEDETLQSLCLSAAAREEIELTSFEQELAALAVSEHDTELPVVACTGDVSVGCGPGMGGGDE